LSDLSDYRKIYGHCNVLELAKTQSWLMDAYQGKHGLQQEGRSQMTLALKVESFRMGSVLLWKDRGW
jgi:hypothetical protein